MLETLHRHQRTVVAAALMLVTAAAWAYTALGVGMDWSAVDMTLMAWRFADMAMARPEWTGTYAAAVFLMWWVMMAAMMLPTALPMVLLYAAVVRRREGETRPYLSIALFAAGYLVIWGLFSLAAAGAQAALDGSALLSPMMTSASSWLSGGLLAAAGIYQLTPLKEACLSHCRSPVAFVAHHWRRSAAGALRMGVEHGLYCLGCCWALMALLFVGGVMNLFWIGAIALYILIEKVLARGAWINRGIGVGLIASGALVLLRAA